ncbi:hypothetical protein HYQ45_009985 [Verticillium longisporum]|uniref:Uncharacterized protein n=1 Tax=Verticillium longisporum TaxID=100787 RepID=A0A8I2ZH33_VERLO|nr:hypothetical protein HYQ45_009985 [Verticillium longisporum]
MARSSISPVDCSAADGLTSLLAATSYLDPQTFAQQSAQTDHEQPLPHNTAKDGLLDKSIPGGSTAGASSASAGGLSFPSSSKLGK